MTDVDRCGCETCVAFTARISEATPEARAFVLRSAAEVGWPPAAASGLGGGEGEGWWRGAVELARFAELVELLGCAHRGPA